MISSPKNKQVYSYSENLYGGKGEGFLINNNNYAVSLFRYPNTNSLRGIGLHYHPNCDDIDIIIDGSFNFYNNFYSGTKCTYPCIILTKRNTPHGFIADKHKQSLIYGFRSPFKEGVVVNKKTKFEKKSMILPLNNYHEGEHELFNTEYTVGILHKNVTTVPIRPIYKNRVIFNLGNHFTYNKQAIGKYKVIEATCNEEIRIDCRNCLAVELIPKYQEKL